LANYTYTYVDKDQGLALAKQATDLGYGIFYSMMAGRARDNGQSEEEMI